MSTSSIPAVTSDHPFASWVGHHAAIRIPDYEVSKDWFVDRLGWRVTQEWIYGDLQLAYIAPPGDDHFHVEILAGPGAVAQPQYDSVDASLTQNGLNHVCIQVASVDDSLAELRRRDVTNVGEPFELEAIDSRLAFFADPFGDLFELKQSLGAGARGTMRATTADANRATIGRAFAAWQDGSAPITDVFASDMVWRIEGHSVASRQYADRQVFVDEVLVPFGARFARGERFRPVEIRTILRRRRHGRRRVGRPRRRQRRSGLHQQLRLDHAARRRARR